MKPIVVVGAGIVGASIAYHLARVGAAVTVVGRDAGVTAASFAWIGADGNGDWPGGAAALSGLVVRDWRRIAAEVPGVGVRWTGSLRWPVGPSPQPGPPGASPQPEPVPSGEGAEPVPVHAGAGPGLVGPDTVAALEPHLRAIPHQAIYAPDDGGVDPAAAARALLAAARSRGARTVLGTTVRRIGADGVLSSAGFLPASVVVVAAGAGTAALTRHLTPGEQPDTTRIGGTSPALLIRLRAERAGLVRGIVATPDLEVREVRDRELLVAAPLGPTWTWTDLRTAGRRARHELTTAFGDGDRLLRGWRVGIRPMPHGGPVVGRLTPYVYVAVMHSAVCLAPSVGRLAATEILSGETTPELAGCHPHL